jgi:hypothetical protein
MIRIAITAAAFEAIKATLPLGSVGFEPEPDVKGALMIATMSFIQRNTSGW